MMVQRIVAFALAYVAGIAWATATGTILPVAPLACVSVAGFGVSLYLYAKERQWTQWHPAVVLLAATLAAFPLGYARTIQQTGPAHPDSLRYVMAHADAGTSLQLQGTICAEPQLRGARRADLKLKVDHVRTSGAEPWQPVKPGKILLRLYWMKRSTPAIVERFHTLSHPDAYGYRIEVETSRQKSYPTLNPGEFDMEAYLDQADLVASQRTYAGRVAVLDRTRGNPLTEVALMAKQRFLSTYRHTIRAPASRLVAAATLGTRHALDKQEYRGLDITQSFRHAGVGHVLAVSGLHVSIVSILLYTMFRMVGLRPRVFVPIHIGMLILFAILTGARPSSVRAVIMNAIVLIALAYLRCALRSATKVGLALASLMMLLINPLLLFSPGFLLSFGAVLSLLTLSPALMRCLGRLRGFALIFFGLWVALMMGLCFDGLDIFLDLRHVIAFVGLLWLAIVGGGALNGRYPRMWRVGFTRIHPAFLMLVSAQFAIQIGMMIPMSAWFFGQFPVAGMVINLLAIPAIGVLVQLGMMTGILGLIPWIGTYLALPFGVADTLVGQGFFALAHAGATWFPFPAAPRPTVGGLAAYYIAVALLLALEARQVRIQSFVYRLWPRFRGRRWTPALPYAIPILLCLIPLARPWGTPGEAVQLTCLASGRYPLVALQSSDRQTVLINGGAPRRGDRVIFDALRELGSVSIETLVVTSPDPSAGMSALAALPGKLSIDRALVPAVSDDRETYLAMLGDSYIVQKDQEDVGWAVNYGDAFMAMQAAFTEHDIPMSTITPGPVVEWRNATVEVLPGPESLPTRYVTSARTPLVAIEWHGFRWLIITDTVTGSLKQVLARETEPFDIVVMADMTSRKSFSYLLSAAVEGAKPRIVILSGTVETDAFDHQAWEDAHPGIKLLRTAREGALTATLTPEGTLQLRGHRSNACMSL